MTWLKWSKNLANVLFLFRSLVFWKHQLYLFISKVFKINARWKLSLWCILLSIGFLDQKTKLIWFTFTILSINLGLSQLEAFTYGHTLVKDCLVKSFTKGNHCKICNLLAAFYTDNMISPSIQEYFTCEFRVARCHEYEFKVSVRRLNKVLEHFLTNQLSFSILSFKK